MIDAAVKVMVLPVQMVEEEVEMVSDAARLFPTFITILLLVRTDWGKQVNPVSLNSHETVSLFAVVYVL